MENRTLLAAVEGLEELLREAYGDITRTEETLKSTVYQVEEITEVSKGMMADAKEDLNRIQERMLEGFDGDVKRLCDEHDAHHADRWKNYENEMTLQIEGMDMVLRRLEGRMRRVMEELDREI
ncbi:hypothetical protein FOL47_001108 [Perkinsus chesapeaki]|uniref:Uncharacterized protein n=1 Tax=Perkinsus chesapeaki TaxID=330153 RepID=A0A7J6KV87_PERCH|nr:hypothetical protein FOL47_001108 [Perkinsus chesapeaki]